MKLQTVIPVTMDSGESIAEALIEQTEHYWQNAHDVEMQSRRLKLDGCIILGFDCNANTGLNESQLRHLNRVTEKLQDVIEAVYELGKEHGRIKP